jgi:drug/metabolite transporter (DMT)-like permease
MFYLTSNTAPFWASLMGLLLLGERLKVIESIALVISFIIIAIIAVTDNSEDDPPAQNENQIWIGLCFGLVAAAGTSLGAVATRRLQDMHYSVLISYYSLFALVIFAKILLWQLFFAAKGPTIHNYTPRAYGEMFLCSLTNAFGAIFQTLAYQNERSGVVTLIGYIGLVYAFLADIFLFEIEYSNI